MTYIYNDAKNLRTSLDRVYYCAQVPHPEHPAMLLAIVECDDIASGDWSRTKTYCGLMTAHHDESEIRNILHYGTSFNKLRNRLNDLY